MCTKHVKLNKKASADEAGAETGAVEGAEGAGNVAGIFHHGEEICCVCVFLFIIFFILSFFLNPESTVLLVSFCFFIVSISCLPWSSCCWSSLSHESTPSAYSYYHARIISKVQPGCLLTNTYYQILPTSYSYYHTHIVTILF